MARQQPPLATAWNLNIQNSPLLSMADAFTNPAKVDSPSTSTPTTTSTWLLCLHFPNLR